MKKKLLAFCAPAGLLIITVYQIASHFMGEVPNSIGYPFMIISIILMGIGIAYNGYCFAKRKNPFDFR